MEGWVCFGGSVGIEPLSLAEPEKLRAEKACKTQRPATGDRAGVRVKMRVKGEDRIQ